MSAQSIEEEAYPDAGAVAALDATVARARASVLYAERLRGHRIRALADVRSLPFTTREDLQGAGIDGTRAVPLERVCHYGETSGTSGASNSTWLTAEDFERNARAITARHPDVFAPGRVLLNRFPFMAAPAHLIQLIARLGGGVAVPAGNINWDVPFPRALALAQQTRAQVLAGMPLEPIVLGRIARMQGLDPAKATSFDTFFLGGAALPPALQRRIEREWGVRVIELYGSTETMLLGTSCSAGNLHLETDLAFCEVLRADATPAGVGEEGQLVITTLGVEGSPLVRFESGDLVRRLPPCACGDPRPSIVVLGRASEVCMLGGRRLLSHEILDAAAAAADALDSSVFFAVVLPDRLLVRIEAESGGADPERELRARLGELPLEVELVGPQDVLDVELMSRSPSVYKPVAMADWTRPGRRILSMNEGMIDWPRPTLGEGWRWLSRNLRRSRRRRRLERQLPAAGSQRLDSGHER